MVQDIMPVAITGTREDLERVAEMDRVVDALHLAIIEFLGKVSLANLSKRQSKELMKLAEITNGLEQIGDRVATAMVTSAHKRIDEEVSVSPQTAEVLTEYHAMVVAALSDALNAVASKDADLAKEVSQRKKDFSELSRNVMTHGLNRLTADEPNRLKTYAREMEVMEILDGVFTVSRRIARTQL
jgi:phosphate:Na+ symporter